MMIILCIWCSCICDYTEYVLCYYTEHDAYVIHTQYSYLYEQLYLLIIITCYLLLLYVESASPSILDSVNTHVYYTHPPLSPPSTPPPTTLNMSQNSDPKSGIVHGRNPNLSPPVYEQGELGENSLLMQVCDVCDEEGVMRPTYILNYLIVQCSIYIYASNLRQLYTHNIIYDQSMVT